MGRFAPSLLVRLALLATAILPMGAGARSDDAAAAPAPINHVIVIYMENHSFDNLYGYFPGAEGLSRASIAGMQIGEDGKHDANLPRVVEAGIGLKLVDQRFPELINQPFDIGRYVGLTSRTTDLVHRFYQEQMQINGGKMDRFAAVSDAGGLTMGHYDGSQLPLWSYALRYTLADHFFHAAFGGSMLNHFWLVCACTPTFPDAPAELRARVDGQGNMVGDGAVTPDGYVVNNLESANSPHRASTPSDHLVPLQTAPHIGDRLDAAGLSWAWYGGGWSESLAGRMTPYSTYITEPFAYFANMADGTEGRARHLKDEEDFLPELASGFLPAVSFIKPADDEHPGRAGLMSGDRRVADLVRAVQDSPYWNTTAIIVTYDENGGYWDHVAPPVVDRWGPGTRVPTIIISPRAKHGFVDHTVYDTTSILKFIEWRWGLEPLSDRDANANNLVNAFDFAP